MNGRFRRQRLRQRDPAAAEGRAEGRGLLRLHRRRTRPPGQGLQRGRPPRPGGRRPPARRPRTGHPPGRRGHGPAQPRGHRRPRRHPAGAGADRGRERLLPPARHRAGRHDPGLPPHQGRPRRHRPRPALPPDGAAPDPTPSPPPDPDAGMPHGRSQECRPCFARGRFDYDLHACRSIGCGAGGAAAARRPGMVVVDSGRGRRGCSRPTAPLDRAVKEFALPARPTDPPGGSPGVSRAAVPDAGAWLDGAL